MKKVFLMVGFTLASFLMEAQITTPAPSPASKLEQTIGLTDVTVDYSRPSMRGRVIFGDLVAYNELWRTGANARTKITFSDDVIIDEQELKAGSYAIFTKPGMQTWDVFFYTEAEGGGNVDWDESKVAAKTTVEVYPLPMDIETFTISFDDLKTNSGNLGLMWEKAYIGIPIEVPTESKVLKNIETTMASNPKADDYYAAAVYYANEDKDIAKAKEWMGKAMSMIDDPAYWQLRQQSLILAKSGDKKGAIDAAKKSLAKAKDAGNNDYVKMNNNSLKEWGAL